MAEKPQFFEEYQWVSAIDQAERQLIGAKTQLQSIKTALETIKTAVDADQDSTTDMVTLATAANSLVNNVKYTDFLTYITNNVG